MNKYITLPTDFIIDSNTTLKEKILLAEIHNLSSLEKGCIASNNHFEKLLGFTKKSTSNSMSNLVKKGILDIKLSDRNNTRIIKIIDINTLNLLSTKSGGVSTKSGGVSTKSGGVSTKSGGVSTKSGESKENNSFNNSFNNTSLEEIVSLWNEYASANDKSKVLKLTGKRRDKLLTRIKEFKDFKEAFKIALSKASTSSFCKSGKWFSFDWLVENDTNLVKVIEEKYADENNDKGWK